MSKAIRFIVMMMVLLGVVLSLLVPWRFRVLEKRELLAEFRRETDAGTMALDREISLNLEVLYALKCLFLGSQKVEAGEFFCVAAEAMDRHAGIEALTWVPCTVEGPQTFFEVSRQADTAALQFHQAAVDGRSPVAGEEGRLPALPSIPEASFVPFLGLDLASAPAIVQLLQTTRDAGRVRVAGLPELAGVKDGRQLFLGLLPVYADGAVGVLSRRDHLHGFVLGIFDFATMFRRAGWRDISSLGTVRLVEDSDGGKPRELFALRRDKDAPLAAGFHYERGVMVGGQPLWHLQAKAVEAYFDSNRSMTPWLFVLVGTLLTLVAPLYLWLTARHTTFVEELVARRTRELDEANRKLASLSLTDGLTGIANRRYFDDHLNLEWSRAARDRQPLSLVMVDIDHFKAFNDHYGHLAGDDCLRQVARVLKNIASRPGDLVARYGGEEFALILPHTENGARVLGERCRAAVAGIKIPHHASPVRPVVTVSVGVSSILPGRDQDPSRLIEAADRALYRAKLLGRNRVVEEEVAPLSVAAFEPAD